MLIDNCPKGYLDGVKAFAESIGMLDQLQGRLDQLIKGDREMRCTLRKDFAPHSFTFVLEMRKPRERYLVELAARTEEMKRFHPTGTVAQHRMWAHDETPKWSFLYNGGLIYHGPHDGGGNGGAPTFSVCLTPTSGWSIHT